jgi:hypothetical protein
MNDIEKNSIQGKLISNNFSQIINSPSKYSFNLVSPSSSLSPPNSKNSVSKKLDFKSNDSNIIDLSIDNQKSNTVNNSNEKLNVVQNSSKNSKVIESIKPIELFKCIFCETNFNNKENLTKHLSICTENDFF